MKLIDTIEILENLIHGDDSLKKAATSATKAGEFTISANITQARASLMQQIRRIVINEEGILESIEPEIREIYLVNFSSNSNTRQMKDNDTLKNKAS